MRFSQENGNSQGAACPQAQTPCRQKTPCDGISYKFPKSARLLRRSEYQRIIRTGQRNVGNVIIVDSRLGKSFFPKLGLTVSKKYGKAHRRNRFKRVAREAFRLCYHKMPSGLELNVLPKLGNQKISTQEILSDLLAIIERLKQ
jgi:ribonuclease P protein component